MNDDVAQVWAMVYAASIAAGNSNAVAKVAADQAVADYVTAVDAGAFGT